MERTLEDMKKELELAIEEKKPLSEAIDVINKRIRDINNEMKTYKLNNKLYHPMSELTNHKGKDIYSITLVERKEDGTLDTEYIYNDEIFRVDDNGHLKYSSFNCGVMNYDKKIDKYVKWCHFTRKEHDYIGFLDVEFDD